MREIDFLPEWYKSGRRREVSYRTQYIALGGVFVVMMVWSLTATRSISKARAESAQMAAKQSQAESVSSKLAELESELRGLQKRAESIEEIDSKIDVASVLAEMSFLIDEEVVLNKVEFVAEKFVDKQETKRSQRAGAIVRAVRARSGDKRDLPLGNVRFKVVIAGVAADASDVAALICKLEDSPYFCQVVPSFSRNAEMGIEIAPSLRTDTDIVTRTLHTRDGVQGAEGKIQVSEFEINCYLANYREQ
jgi:Tfp pilus assembly protein PilN